MKTTEVVYEFAKDMDILNGGDGKMHVEEKEDGNHYSGPMNSEEFDRFFHDEDAILDLEL